MKELKNKKNKTITSTVSILNLGDGSSVTIVSGATVKFAGLELTPDSNYTISEINSINLERGTVSLGNNANSMDKIYSINFDILNFTGTIVYIYEDSDMNGLSHDVSMYIYDSVSSVWTEFSDDDSDDYMVTRTFNTPINISKVTVGATNNIPGCTDQTACNYDSTATIDDGTCILPDGCTDSNACNYDSSAQCDDGSCEYTSCSGCTDSTACNYDSNASIDDGTCILPDGCTDSNACNYDPTAQCDDGSCILPDGCTNPTACNFDPTAQCDDGSCLIRDGCTDESACNYDSTAQCDDGSCLKHKFFITGNCSNTNYNLITIAGVAVAGGVFAFISSSKGKTNKKKKED